MPVNLPSTLVIPAALPVLNGPVSRGACTSRFVRFRSMPKNNSIQIKHNIERSDSISGDHLIVATAVAVQRNSRICGSWLLQSYRVVTLGVVIPGRATDLGFIYPRSALNGAQVGNSRPAWREPGISRGCTS